MRSRLVQLQLVVFGIVGTLAVVYAGYSYAGFQRYTGLGTYTVTADLRNAGGLYPNALVTYRGVDVGVVTSVDLRPTGARASLQIAADDAIPANAQAFVRSVSIAGEQFIDLVPTSAQGPKLVDGSRIAQSNTNIPVPATEVIKQVYGLLSAVPKKSLHTTVDEASIALDRTGPDLNRALRASTELVALAKRNLPSTTSLITSLGPVLSQLEQSGPDISAFATNLNAFTAQLAMSDGKIATALQTGAPFFDVTTGLLDDLRPTLPVLLANLQTVGEVLRVNVGGLRHILIVYPETTAAINAMHAGFQDPSDTTSGQGRLDVKLGNSNNPPPCTAGYGATQRRDPSDVSPAPQTNAYCNLPHSDYRAVRGARNLPCATNRSVRTGDLSACPGGLPSTWPQMLARPKSAAGSPTPRSTRKPRSTQPAAAVPYDVRTGRFTTPEGTTYQLGTLLNHSAAKGVKTTWQQLFPVK